MQEVLPYALKSKKIILYMCASLETIIIRLVTVAVLVTCLILQGNE